MKRKLFTLLAAISLLLCVASVFVWIGTFHNGHTTYLNRVVTDDRFLLSDSNRIDFARGGTDVYLIQSWARLSHIREVEARMAASRELDQFDINLMLLNQAGKGWHTGIQRDLNPRYPYISALKENWFDLAIWKAHADIGDGNEGYRTIALGFPIWSITCLSAIAPTIWLRRFVRACRNAREGHCATCGYDLRATPERCPECGAAPQRMVDR